jgi:hypothetical protein
MKTGNMNTPGNSRTALYTLQTLILLLAFALAVGCRSTGYRKGDAAGKSLREAAAEVQTESQAIDVTLNALNDLVNKPAVDVKPQFHRFSAALNHLMESAKQTERTRERMELKSAEYFDAWDKQVAGINYGIIREHSENRKTDVTNRFHLVNSRYEEAQAVVRPLITYFNDIRKALSVDLTTAGLESVKSIVGNADQNSRKVQTALARLAEDLTTSGTDMSSVVLRNTQSSPEETRTSVRTETSDNRTAPSREQ